MQYVLENNITLNKSVDASSPSMRPEARQIDLREVQCLNSIDDAKVEAKIPYIKIGIEYLRGVPGKPASGPGPGNCGRVSCWGESAIYWCNDVCPVWFFGTIMALPTYLLPCYVSQKGNTAVRLGLTNSWVFHQFCILERRDKGTREL